MLVVDRSNSLLYTTFGSVEKALLILRVLKLHVDLLLRDLLS